MLPDTKELNAQTAFTTAHTKLTFLDANISIFPPVINMDEYGNIKMVDPAGVESLILELICLTIDIPLIVELSTPK